MTKEYAFQFLGTKEDFLDILNQYPNNYGKFYYFDDYIVKIVDDQIHFGVESHGHSGGNWFMPTITEFDDRIEFSGKIRYIGPGGERNAIGKAVDNIEFFLLGILLLPIILISKLYMLIKWCVRKICKQTEPKERTTEEKLYDLMEKYLNCKKIEA